MALPTLTWSMPAAEIFTGGSVSDIITALYNIFNTTGVAGWSVADFSSTEAHLIVKPSDANVSNMRIAFFGGQTPNAAALDSDTCLIGVTSSANYIYCLLSKDVGVDTFDQSYTVGHPWATSDPDCAGAILWSANGTNANFDRAQIWACAEGLVAQIYDASAIFCYTVYAGALLTSIATPDSRNYVCGGGNQPAFFWKDTSTVSEFIAYGPSTGTHPRNVVYDGDNIRGGVRHSYAGGYFGPENLNNADGTKNYFLPILLQADTNANLGQYTLGHLRQLAIGPSALRNQTVVEGGAIKGYAVTTDTTTARDTLWLLNE